MAKHNFEDYTHFEDYATQEEIIRIKTELLTCPDINNNLAGTIISLSKNHAKSVLITNEEMSIDNEDLVFDAFVFGAANYVAQAAINKEFSLVIGCKCFFYGSLKVGDVLELEANALFDENSKKRDVRVVGNVKEIKLFEANIQIVVTDEHIFKLKRPPNTSSLKPIDQAPAEENGTVKPSAQAMAVALTSGLNA